MKKRILAIMLVLFTTLPFTGCTGGSDGGSYSTIESQSATTNDYSYDASNDMTNGAGFNVDTDSYKSADSYDENENYDYAEEESMSENETTKAEDVQQSNNTTIKNDEKLVYSGNISIDTLTYDDSLVQFKKILEENQGFIETEDYSDGGDYYDNYYREDEQKYSTYTARIRVPSKNYDKVMSGVSTLGDVRSKNSNVQNFTQEYKDVEISLDILNQEYESYSKLLQQAKKIDDIIRLTDQLNTIKVQIEQAKSRLKSIDNDVAYSYIDITIKEVTKYTEEPPKKDTFFDRLKSTVHDSIDEFGDFLEGILFALIMLAPYIVLIVVVIIPISVGIRKHNERLIREGKKSRKTDLNEQFNNLSRYSTYDTNEYSDTVQEQAKQMVDELLNEDENKGD